MVLSRKNPRSGAEILRFAQNDRKGEIWGLKVVGYLFLAGLGSGAFGAAAGLDLHTNGQSRDLTNIGAWIGLLGVGLGALLLLWDLGMPHRFFRLVGNKSSLISAGTVILTVLLVLASITIIVAVFSPGISPTVYRALMVLAAGFGLATSIYVGFLLAVVKCRPFWNTPLLPLLFVVSSFSTGVSALSSVASTASGLRVPAAAADILSSGEVLLLGLELVMVAFYVATMENALPQARIAVRRWVRGDLAAVFWLGIVVGGLMLPLVLMVAGVLVPPPLVAILILAGGFSLRYGVLSAGARSLVPGEAQQAAFVR